jgi:hypothetical protein
VTLAGSLDIKQFKLRQDITPVALLGQTVKFWIWRKLISGAKSIAIMHGNLRKIFHIVNN